MRPTHPARLILVLVFGPGLASVAGCAIAPTPGSREAAVPPRLVLRDNVPTWDSPAGFGPVPPALASLAAQTCGALDTPVRRFVATGFHTRAQDLEGSPLPGGGFYCAPR